MLLCQLVIRNPPMWFQVLAYGEELVVDDLGVWAKGIYLLLLNVLMPDSGCTTSILQ